MRMNLTIFNMEDRITWELWGRGLSIERKTTDYPLIINAVIAAKRVAKNLHIEIGSVTYFEPLTEYSQPLKI